VQLVDLGRFVLAAVVGLDHFVLAPVAVGLDRIVLDPVAVGLDRSVLAAVDPG